MVNAEPGYECRERSSSPSTTPLGFTTWAKHSGSCRDTTELPQGAPGLLLRFHTHTPEPRDGSGEPAGTKEPL